MEIWDFKIDYDNIAISFFCDELLFSEYVGIKFTKVREEGDREGVGAWKTRYIEFTEPFPVISGVENGKRFELKIIEMVIKRIKENVFHYWVNVFYDPKFFGEKDNNNV